MSRMTRKPAARRQKPKRAADDLLLVATRKGAWIFRADTAKKTWKPDGPHFLGHVISQLALDPRDGKTLLAAAKTGHLGPTIFRSTDRARTWTEAARPPAFAKASEGVKGRAGESPRATNGAPLPGRVVDHTFWLAPGHAREPGVWYAGTSPQGLFRSEDGGATWEPVSGLNDDARYRAYMGDEQAGTPDGPKLHSIIVDPRDPAHLYMAMSSGGVHESTDRGRSWTPLSDGLDVVEGFEPGNLAFHDPHCIRLCPSNPDRLYQQNHCGIYRLDRPERRWTRVGKNMPKKIGDIGFPLAVHPRDADTAWVFPMDGTTVWPRTSPGGAPAAYVTRDGGKTWRRLDAGLPKRQAWWTVKRQAMCADAGDPVGLYLGTTSGELWMGANEGRRWSCIARHLPEIYAVEVAEAR